MTQSPERRPRVLIVDDSALMRELMSEILSASGKLDVVGTATDPLIAREKIKSLNPDVITLDIEMPRMDGLSFLERLMALRPMPVVIVSTLAQHGADTTLRALELGAVDYVPKPTSDLADALSSMESEIVEKVCAAAAARVRQRAMLGRSAVHAAPPAPVCDDRLIAIGSSTGGVEALQELLPALPADCPPVAVVQHMPPGFTAQFAARLDKRCAAHVREAEDGLELARGMAVIAKGGNHLAVAREGRKLRCRVYEGPLESGHRPSVDCLFQSVADNVKSRAVGAILTGMGHDGTKGLLAMRQAGARTFGQNEESCLIYGMPKSARLAGAVEEELTLTQMAGALLSVEVR